MLIFFVLTILQPESVSTIPESCSMTGYTENTSFQIREFSQLCLYTRPGFFFGSNLIIDAYWQDEDDNSRFKHIGPVKSASIVNIDTKMLYVVIYSTINQTILHYPTYSMSKYVVNTKGTSFEYNYHFSTKSINSFPLRMSYVHNDTCTKYTYDSLLVIGKKITIRDSSPKKVAETVGNSIRTESSDSTNVTNDMQAVTLGQVAVMNSDNNFLIERKIDINIEEPIGIPLISGKIPLSPSISRLSDIDISYNEPMVHANVSSPVQKRRLSPYHEKFLIYSIVSAVAIAMLVGLAVIVIVIVIKARNSRKIEQADMKTNKSTDTSVTDYYSTTYSDCSIPQSIPIFDTNYYRNETDETQNSPSDQEESVEICHSESYYYDYGTYQDYTT